VPEMQQEIKMGKDTVITAGSIRGCNMEQPEAVLKVYSKFLGKIYGF
jgi:hypothetical protein